jgi:hypothetical protein
MQTFGTIVMVLGIGAAAIAQLWVLIAAFKKSLVWGLLVFFLPFAALVFVILYFDEMKMALAMYVIAVVVAVAGGGIAYRGLARQMRAQEIARAAAAQQ